VALCWPAFAAAQSATACATAALEEYNKETLALLSSPDALPIASIEVAVALRRLQERYCLQDAKCLYPNAISSDVRFRSAFATCLRDETKDDN
jgi:hypothetical protein